MTTIRKMDALNAARYFVAEYVRAGRQWNTETLASYLPHGLRLRSDAVYSGPATIADVAAFLRREVRQDAQ